MGRVTVEQQLKSWTGSHELRAKGWKVPDIAQELGIAIDTVYRYLRSPTPPRPVAQHGCPYGRPTRENYTGPAMPPAIVDLRERLIAAFLAGDLEEHGRLCIELKQRFKLFKATAAKLNESSVPALTEAAE